MSSVSDAMRIVEDRQKQRKNLKNHSRESETMHDVVQQKKDIFIVTMTTQIIRKERERLCMIIKKKETDLSEYEIF